MKQSRQDPISFDSRGITKVAEVAPEHFGALYRFWSVPQGAMATATGDDTSKIALFVANEWIDWVHFRNTGNYRPLNSENNLR